MRPKIVSDKHTEPDEMPWYGPLERMEDRILFDQMLRVNSLVVPHRIIFGKGAARNAGDEGKAIGAGTVMLVTDPHIVKSGVMADVVEGLRTRDVKVHVFSEVEPEPSIETADRVTREVREQRFDLVCGVGGGSVMDIAKIASVMATNAGETKEYLGTGLFRKPGLPKILLPTTAGTGSEMTPNAIVGMRDGTKTALISPHILADVAIVDPMLTLTLPTGPTAVSGVDALTHAIESYISLDANPITDLFSLRAIELIARYLPIAFSRPQDIQARSAMCLASTMAGISIANAGTCSGHAAAYAYAGKYKIPHGFSVGAALPYILEFSLVSCPEKARAIARALGEDSGDVASGVAHAVVGLMQKVGCPTSLSELGIPKAEIGTIVREMLKMTRLLVHNPRPVNESDAFSIISRMWEGYP